MKKFYIMTIIFLAVSTTVVAQNRANRNTFNGGHPVGSNENYIQWKSVKKTFFKPPSKKEQKKIREENLRKADSIQQLVSVYEDSLKSINRSHDSTLEAIRYQNYQWRSHDNEVVYDSITKVTTIYVINEESSRLYYELGRIEKDLENVNNILASLEQQYENLIKSNYLTY